MPGELDTNHITGIGTGLATYPDVASDMRRLIV